MPTSGCTSPTGGRRPRRRVWPASVQEWEAFLPHDPVDADGVRPGPRRLVVMARRNGVAAGLLAAGAVLYVAGGGAGRLWPALAEVGTPKVLSVGVWCCAVPAAYGLTAIAGGIGSSSGFKPLGLVWLAAGLAGLSFGLDLPRRWTVAPLEIGLGDDREDDRPGGPGAEHPRGPHPVGGRRRYLAGRRVDGPPPGVDPAALPRRTVPRRGHRPPARPAGGRQTRRPAGGDWSDDELARFFDRYNVTRAVCRSPDAVARFRRLRGAAVVAEFEGGAGRDVRPRPAAGLRPVRDGGVTQLDWRRVAAVRRRAGRHRGHRPEPASPRQLAGVTGLRHHREGRGRDRPDPNAAASPARPDWPGSRSPGWGSEPAQTRLRLPRQPGPVGPGRELG